MSRRVSDRSRAPVCACALALPCAFAAPRAHAQAADAAEATAALALRNQGLDELHAGRARDAVATFERSLSVVESPNTRLDLGRALVAAGQLAEGLHELERARDVAQARTDAGLGEYALTARAAAEEADALRPRVPMLTVGFSQPPPADSTLEIGRARMPATAISSAVPVDPGAVRVRLAGPSLREFVVVRTMAAGQRAAVWLEVRPGRSGATPSLPQPAGDPRGTMLAAGIGLGLGGAVVAATGLGAWLASDGTFNALRAECPAGPCTDPRQIQRADAGQALEVAGVVLMVGGALVAATGGGLALASRLRTDRMTVTPTMGARAAGVTVRF